MTPTPILPCPLCGAIPRSHQVTNGKWRVTCTNDECGLSCRYMNIEHWNRRAPNAESELRERFIKAINDEPEWPAN